MKHYNQLTSEQRYQISGLLKAGYKPVAIATEIGVNKSTISRELKRNRGHRGWRPKQAQAMRDERRRSCINAQRFTSEDWACVEDLIQRKFSPEQAAERLALEGNLRISPETIYRRVYANKRQGGDLWQQLRCQKPYRKRYGSGQERRGVIPNRIGIEQRPAVVEERSRLGDWEGDTVIGKNHRGALVTLAERKSRYVLASPVPSKHADGVTAAITRLLSPHRRQCHTLTLDNGKEFAGHEKIAAALEIGIYFAHPYHSWERGLNENSNGLLRQFFPKAMALTHVTVEDVQRAVDSLNHRPRKVLGFRSPFEVFFGKRLRYTKPPLSVALRK